MPKQEIVIICGRSGAGKTIARKALEDLGYFVIDNLPPELIDALLALTMKPRVMITKIAMIIDISAVEFIALWPKKWLELDSKLYHKRWFYLHASEKQLIERYHETKRKHPLDDGIGINAALALEEDLLQPLKALASEEIFSDNLSPHELSSLIKQKITHIIAHPLTLSIQSFGFKYGIPLELDLCLDVRFLKNPYYQAELKHKTGEDDMVYDYVLALPHAQGFIAKVYELLNFLYPLYQEEGKTKLVLAIGCTGGKHRSVALAKALYHKLKNKVSWPLRLEHRDMKR